MTPLPLRGLLASLGRALVEAQVDSDEQHLRQLDRYLGPDGTPLTRRIRLRDPSPTAPDGRRDLDVPLLALVPRTSIRFRRLVLDVDADDIDFDDIDVGPGDEVRIAQAATGTSARVRLGLASPAAAGRRLHIVTEAVDPAPPAAPGADRTERTPADDFAFTVRARLTGEKEIDVDDQARLLLRVDVAQTNPESPWAVESATVLLDVVDLPPTVSVIASQATWLGDRLAVDIRGIRPGSPRELEIRLLTGRFAGGRSAEPGSYGVRVGVRASYRLREPLVVDHEADPITIEVAPD